MSRGKMFQFYMGEPIRTTVINGSKKMPKPSQSGWVREAIEEKSNGKKVKGKRKQ